MRQLGNLYLHGLGVALDLDEACKWYRQAAALGDMNSKHYARVLASDGHAPSVLAVSELGLGPL